MINRTFVDTSAWIMLINKSESHHHKAVEIYRQLINSELVVTNLVVSETYTWLRRKDSDHSALRFLDSMQRKVEIRQLEVIYSDYGLEQEAIKLLKKYREHKFSFADAVSFIIMKKMGMEKAFSYDRHFLTAGFEVINEI